MSNSAITLVTNAIHSPGDPRHFMCIRPIRGRIRVLKAGLLLADTTNAIRISEVGHDIYDSVTYISNEDLLVALKRIQGKQTHCPIKGMASYFSLNENQAIAWAYDDPYEFSRELKGYIAFYNEQVTIKEIGCKA